jgi:hypothetical protein
MNWMAGLKTFLCARVIIFCAREPGHSLVAAFDDPITIESIDLNTSRDLGGPILRGMSPRVTRADF